jgi:hypothetical protein
MTPQQVQRLRALELQVAAIAEQISALVSEAEHGTQEAKAAPALETAKEPAAPQFYGGWTPGGTPPAESPSKESLTHAPPHPRRARRSP